jgi:PAS domain S-box-containing protein
LVVSDTPRALLGSIFAELTEVIGADAFLNYWVAPSGDRLILEVSGGITEEQKSAFAELKMGEAVAGKVAASREPTILSDIQHDPDPQAEQLLRLGLRTYAVLPILTGEHLIGTVSFASSRVDRFDPEDLQVMKAVADQVAAALERSSLVEELRVSNERFRTLVEQAADAMMVYDTEGRLVDVNPQACDNLGYSRAELIGLSLQDVVVDFNLQRAQAAWARARDHGHQTITTVHRRRDGSTFPVEVRFGTIQFDHRELIIGQVRDTTERSRAEAAIRESEERFRQVVENIEEVFWMTDVAQSRLLYISPGFERIWGRTSRELYASLESWIDTVHPEDRARILRAAREKQVMGDYDETYRIVRPDGTVRWIHETAYPVRDGAGAVSRIVGVAADITEQRQLETQVRQAQKMEAIGTLAGGIAHDFNNILGAIIGFAELARLKLANYPEAYGEIDGVLEGARRAAGLVGQILASSRRQEPRRVPVQLCQVVAESLRLLRATLPSGIEFDIRLPSTLPAVLADPDQVHQVVMNLCTNASQAIGKETGRLTVSAELLTIDDLTRATHAGLRVGPYVRLSVSDTGCGMDRATLERIFEPFFTTKAPGEGTGLGLSVVHGIMKAHDGTVTVYSQPGQGTTFHLYFPANTIAGQAAIPPTPLAARGQGQRILVLDDERPLALLGKRILEELGYLATFHTDAEQAIADVVENPDRFHMIITDLTMPRLSGLEVSRQIHALQPALPILLTTGYPGTLSARDLAETGILQILLKPLTVAALAAAVDEGLASSKS